MKATRLILSANTWFSTEEFESITLQLTGDGAMRVDVYGRIASSRNPEFASGEIIVTGLSSGIVALTTPVDQIKIVVTAGTLTNAAALLYRDKSKSERVILLPNVWVQADSYESMTMQVSGSFDLTINVMGRIVGNTTLSTNPGEILKAAIGPGIYAIPVAVDQIKIQVLTGTLSYVAALFHTEPLPVVGGGGNVGGLTLVQVENALESKKNPINPRSFISTSGLRIGCVGNGIVDDTAVMQEAFKRGEIEGRAIEIPAGNYLVGPLTMGDPATAGFRSGGGNNQGVGAAMVRGAGGFYGPRLTAKPGAYAAGQYVLSRQNLSGVVIEGLMIDCGNTATNGLDLSWVGLANGGASAPSNRNQLRNIWVDGGAQVTTAVNLDQFHDSDISSLHIRCGSTSLTAIGSGGSITFNQLWATGKVAMATQNGLITHSGLYGGLVLTGAGFNNIALVGAHLFVGANGYLIYSDAIGNATRAVTLSACQLNGDVGSVTAIIGGNFHSGAIFENCMVLGPSPVWGELAPTNGARGVLRFRACALIGGLPSMALATPWIAEDCATGGLGLLRGIRSNADYNFFATAVGVNSNLIVTGTVQSSSLANTGVTNTNGVASTGDIQTTTQARANSIISTTTIAAGTNITTPKIDIAIGSKRRTIQPDFRTIADDTQDVRTWVYEGRLRYTAQPKNTWIRLTGIAQNHSGIFKLMISCDAGGAQISIDVTKFQFDSTPLVTGSQSTSNTGLVLNFRWRSPLVSGYNDPEIAFDKVGETGTVNCTIFYTHLPSLS